MKGGATSSSHAHTRPPLELNCVECGSKRFFSNHIVRYLVGHSVDVGPSVVDGELGGIVCLSDQVQVALVVLVSFPRHTHQRLTAADDHCLVLPVDPR